MAGSAPLSSAAASASSISAQSHSREPRGAASGDPDGIPRLGGRAQPEARIRRVARHALRHRARYAARGQAAQMGRRRQPRRNDAPLCQDGRRRQPRLDRARGRASRQAHLQRAALGCGPRVRGGSESVVALRIPARHADGVSTMVRLRLGRRARYSSAKRCSLPRLGRARQWSAGSFLQANRRLRAEIELLEAKIRRRRYPRRRAERGSSSTRGGSRASQLRRAISSNGARRPSAAIRGCCTWRART